MTGLLQAQRAQPQGIKTTLPLRGYQVAAHNAAIDWVRNCTEPGLIKAATGAGKSFIVASLAEALHDMSGGKHVLALAPSAELVLQNQAKFRLTGRPASMFSASAGQKCLRHPVVFGTPMTVANRISRFGSRFCGVILDEAHGITPTVRGIIDSMRDQNPNLRVIGMTATPHRLGDGYIYRLDEHGRPMADYACRNPYFSKLLSRIEARELIDAGFLTEPIVGAINVESYDTSGLELNSRWQFDSGAIDRAFHGHGRKTAAIIADVVHQSQGRMGVMIFAATVQHAHECMASLPPGLSAVVTGTTGKAERARILAAFLSRKIKYLVSVGTLTTGFDAPHVDVIALLRRTESVGLLEQIIGRGLRQHPEKDHTLILDYAGNIEAHCPDGDLFAPDIRASRSTGGNEYITVECPDCRSVQNFSARPNDGGYSIDQHGYFVDLDNNPIMTDHGPMPAHYGRRCQNLLAAGGGRLIQCAYRWTAKQCVTCGNDNDIAARYCAECRAELVDPNEKLRADFKALKRDPTRIQCDRIVALTWSTTLARSGRECIKADFVTDYRSFSVWYPCSDPGSERPPMRKTRLFLEATREGRIPETVTYRKNAETGFYDTLAFDQPADEAPE